MLVRFAVTPVIAALVLTVAACGGSAPEPEAEPEAAELEVPASESTGQRRVYFMQPTSGATVTSPAQFVFGAEMITIAAVPEGEVTEVRADTGHFHLGVDTDCLPAGAVIPKADPWIHFGTGNNTIEMQLAPGPHKFAVQAGDDLHATIAGLCETIEITVTE